MTDVSAVVREYADWERREWPSMTVGPTTLDAVRAIAAFRDRPEGPLADAIMESWGYAPKQVVRALDRVVEKGYAECGVSTRTAWLEPPGVALLERYGRDRSA